MTAKPVAVAVWIWMLAFLVIVPVWWALGTWIGYDFKGPEFLLFFLGVLTVTLIAATGIRWTWRDTWLVSIAGCLAFEGIGALRILTGLSRGMSKFEFLIAIMIVGGFLFFLRLKLEGYNYGSTTSCAGVSSCGGGGCGSSGCGGGGCGGCGGS